MLVQVQVLKESLAVLSLGKLCEENGYSYEWHPGQPSYLVKNERQTKCKTDNHLVVPSVQATENQTKAPENPKRTPAVCDHERSAETQVPEWLQPFTEGLTRGSSRSTDEFPADVAIPLPANPSSAHPPSNTSSNKAGVCKRTKVVRAPCRRNPADRADIFKIAERFGDMITADHKVLNEDQESRLHVRLAVVEQDLTTQWIQYYPCNTKSDQETQATLRTFLRPEENPRSIFFGQASGIYHSLRGAELESREIYAQMPNKWNCRTSCTTSGRRNFVSIGSVWTARKLVGRSHGVYCYLRNVQDYSADGQTPYEPRFNSLLGEPIIPLGAEVKFCPISSLDQGRVHQFGTKVSPGLFVGYALNAGRTLDW